MSRFENLRRRLDPRRLRLGERPINASTPPEDQKATVEIEAQEPAESGRPAAAAPEATDAPSPAEPTEAARPGAGKPAAAAPKAETTPQDAPGRRRILGLPVPLAALAALVVVLGATAAVLAAAGVFDGDEGSAPAPAPTVSGGAKPEPSKPKAGGGAEAAEEIGFPAFATKNTTRVGGSDPAANAAGVALATYPSSGGVDRPVAVTLIPPDDWQAGIAAAVLMAEPVRAPALLSDPDSVPTVTAEALDALSPEGAVQTDGVQAFAIDDASVPSGLNVRRLGGADPAATAAAIEKLHDQLVAGPPDHIVVTSAERPDFAAPAATWAARSGDPVLFADPDRLPKPTAAALARHKKVPVYVLGPSSAVSSHVLRAISKGGRTVRRVGSDDPVTSSVDFARYSDGAFGWNINDPGHGFVVARSDRPLDAVAAAPLSASGTWGPLLLTDDPTTLPGALRGYLLDVKPGYRTDPTRALYNHIWVIGDQEAIDVSQQAALDDLAELARIPSAKPEPEKRPSDTARGKPGKGNP